jgi:hypothetical protein
MPLSEPNIKDEREAAAGWKPWAVGCHWTRGEYTVSTTVCGNRSGYVLVKDRKVIAEFITWAEVERLAR